MDQPLYEELWRNETSHWWFLGRRRALQWAIDRFSHPTANGERARVIELGCGCGANIAALADRYDVEGMDISPDALEYARRRLGDRVHLGHLPDDVPFEPASADIVLMPDVLEHVDEDAASARRAIGLLRPGGILIATVPAYQWLYAPRDKQHHHKRRYAWRQFRRLFEIPEASIELLSFYNTTLFPAAAAARICSKLAPARSRSGDGDLALPPALLNAILAKILEWEGRSLRWLRLPFGLSLIAVVRRVG